MPGPGTSGAATMSWLIGEDMVRGERGKIDTAVGATQGMIIKSGATDASFGVLRDDTLATKYGALCGPTEPSAEYVASVAIAIGAKVYGAASGRVGITNTGEKIGIAKTSASAAGELVEVWHSARI